MFPASPSAITIEIPLCDTPWKTCESSGRAHAREIFWSVECLIFEGWGADKNNRRPYK